MLYGAQSGYLLVGYTYSLAGLTEIDGFAYVLNDSLLFVIHIYCENAFL